MGPGTRQKCCIITTATVSLQDTTNVVKQGEGRKFTEGRGLLIIIDRRQIGHLQNLRKSTEN